MKKIFLTATINKFAWNFVAVTHYLIRVRFWFISPHSFFVFRWFIFFFVILFSLLSRRIYLRTETEKLVKHTTKFYSWEILIWIILLEYICESVNDRLLSWVENETCPMLKLKDNHISLQFINEKWIMFSVYVFERLDVNQ